MEVCANCENREVGQTALRKCAGCLSISYCSTNCQRKHWQIHKKDCSPFKINHDPKLGKQWVATRDLKAGQLLLEEKPLIHFPIWFGNNWVCLSCGLVFNGNRPSTCSTCHWPICTTQCEKNTTHAANECVVFTNQKIRFPKVFETLLWFGKTLDPKFDIRYSNLISGVIKILRALGLKQYNRKSYDKLLRDSYIAADNQFEDDRAMQNQILVMFFVKLINIKELPVRVDEQEILNLLEVINCNNFEWNYGEETRNRAPIHGAYRNLSRMNHSCTPNCNGTFLGFPFILLKMRTVTEVKKGEALSIKYLQTQFELLSRVERQKQIRQIWSFDCHCSRCMDPTELNSFMDGIACKVCRPNENKNLGYLLPQNPLDFKDSSKWTCNHCQASKKYGVIRSIVATLKEDLKAAKILANSEQPYQNLENFIQKTSNEALHPNHYIIQSASRDFIQLWVQPDFKMTRDYFEKAKERSEYLLAVQSLIAPGISFIRGLFLFKLCGLILETMKNISDKFTKAEVEDLLKSAIAHNEEASLFFDHDNTIFKPNRVYLEQLTKMRVIAEKVLLKMYHVPKMALTPDIVKSF